MRGAVLDVLVACAAAGGATALSGSVAYVALEPSTSAMVLNAWDVAANTSTLLQRLPAALYADEFVTNTLLLGDGSTWIVNAQFAAAHSQGRLLEYDLALARPGTSFNSSFCFNLFQSAADATGNTLLCLADVANATSQVTQLRRINRATHADVLVSTFASMLDPVLVTAYDSKRGVLYTTFATLDGRPLEALPSVGDESSAPSGNSIAAINATSGAVLQWVPYPDTVAFLQLEYDAAQDAVIGMVQSIASNGTTSVRLCTVDPATGRFTPLPQSPDFAMLYGQINTVSTLSNIILWFTAYRFTGAGNGSEAGQQLYLVAADARSGVQLYEHVVADPSGSGWWDIVYRRGP